MSSVNKLLDENINIHLSKLTIKNLYDISNMYNININILLDMWNETNNQFYILPKVILEYQKINKNKKSVKKTMIDEDTDEELMIIQ